jgi:hypothetical protein
MKKRTTSRLEMARRALEFCEAHPNPSTGYAGAVADLKALLARSKELADLQQQGTAEARAATRRKRELRDSIRRGPLVHVARAAQRAAREVPELAQKFALVRQPIPYLKFESFARTVAAEAEEWRELLVKHGLVDSVLVTLAESRAKFEQAVVQGAEGRRVHIAAAVGLDVLGDEAIGILKVIDGYNRVRFAGNPDLLAAWRSASNVIGPARPAQKTEPGREAPKSGADEPAA